MEIKERLHPDHYADLKKSGLSDETIQKSGIRSVRPGDINGIFKYETSAISCYEIPYPGMDGYSRYRMFYNDADKINPKTGEERPKYLARKDSGNRLYMPTEVKQTLNNPAIPLYFVEGEKKAMKAAQEEINCVAISGLWNWKTKNSDNLISDFDSIAVADKIICLVPDNDWLLPDRYGNQKNLRQAVYGLAYKLIDRGAKVSWIELPTGDIKTGLDDYLCNYTVADFKNLPAHTIRKSSLTEMVNEATPDIETYGLKTILRGIAALKSETEKTLHINRLHIKTKIPAKMIRGELQLLNEVYEPTDAHIVITHPSYDINPGSRSLSLGFRETFVSGGKTREKNIYLLTVNNNFSIVNDGDVFNIGANCYVFDVKDRVLIGINEKWGKNKLHTFISNPTSQSMYPQIKDITKKYIELQEDGYYGLLSAWIVATYFHRCFCAFPFLFFYGKKGSGKSRMLDLLERVCFNSIKTKGITVASFADSIDGLRGTLLIDQAESLSNPQNEELAGILADSYTCGGGKRRVVHISNKARRILEFETYSPKAFASFKDINPDLKDRCVQINMLRAIDDFQYPEQHLPVWSELRDGLYKYLLMNYQTVLDIYPTTGEGVSHRVRELWRPIETILKLENVPETEAIEIKTVFLNSMQQTQAGLTDFELDLFETLLRMLNDGSEVLTISEISKKLETYKPEDDKRITVGVGKIVNQLCLFTSQAGRKNRQRAYFFESNRVKDIFSRYPETNGFNGHMVKPQQNQGFQTTIENNANGYKWAFNSQPDSKIPLKPLKTIDQNSNGQAVPQQNQGENHVTIENEENEEIFEVGYVKEIICV